MKKLTINLSDKRKYDIIIEEGLLSHLSLYIKEVYKNKDIYIISDDNVALLYLENVKQELQSFYNVNEVIIKAGEASKDIKTYAEVCEKLIDLGLKRNNLILALGGGVVGDLSGFIASTIYRGVEYINIPTSLLSQMDSSIGGKTGVDFHGRKNILGAFKQPLRVLIDPTCHNTLPTEEFKSGMGELIKHATIGNKDLMNRLLDKPKIDEDVIYESLIVKKKHVEEDEFDQGERMKLNFGHTFGHIVEMQDNLAHGIAVGVGMLMAINLGIDLGITNKESYQTIEKVMSLYGLNTTKYDYKKYLSEVAFDKKNLAGVLNFILIKDIGQCIVYPVLEDDIKKLGVVNESNNKTQ